MISIVSGLIISVFLFFAAYILGKVLFTQRHMEDKLKFSFLNIFPFEFNSKTNKTHEIIFKVIYVLSFLSLAFSYIALIFYNDGYNFYQGTLFIIAFLGFLGAFSALSLFFINTNNIKLHLLYFTLLVVSALINSIAIAYLGFYSLNNGFIEGIDTKKIVMSSIECLIILIYLIILLKKKAKNWFSLDEINNNGIIEYRRPKKFFLPYMEWLSTLVIFINLLIVVIMFI